MALPITVGIDGSGAAERALGWAAAEAELRHTSLDVVHVSQFVTVPPGVPPATSMNAALAAMCQKWLDDAVAVVKAVAPEVAVTTELVEDRVLDALARRSAHAQLLVLGARGLGGFAELLVGSTSHALIHHAACPVIVTR